MKRYFLLRSIDRSLFSSQRGYRGPLIGLVDLSAVSIFGGGGLWGNRSGGRSRWASAFCARRIFCRPELVSPTMIGSAAWPLLIRAKRGLLTLLCPTWFLSDLSPYRVSSCPDVLMCGFLLVLAWHLLLL